MQPGAHSARQQPAPCLIRQEGPLAGTVYELTPTATTIGRSAENDVVVSGPDAAVVSGRHAELHSHNGRWTLRDLDSTNGTFVNGERVTECELTPPAVIQLGKGGPELRFTRERPAATAGDPGSTVVAGTVLTSAAGTDQDKLLRQAVARARHARDAGFLNQTGAIMREVIANAVHHSRRRLKWTIATLGVLLAVVSSYAGVRIWQLNQSKVGIDARIASLEKELAAGREGTEADQLASELDQYQNRARALEKSALYRIGVSSRDDFLTHEIRLLLAEFGAEIYSVPPEFRDSVQRYLEQYQGPDRAHMANALTEARPAMDRMRRVLTESALPPDFAYMTLVESALDPDQRSRAGCAGLWQFTPATARGFGLRVDARVDERLNIEKSTHAACKYIRDLILDFGSGSSVMLALAAYNLGPAKVKQAVRRVNDPIKQRNFWYLYHVRALPEETREYVPKVIAAMIIGRQPARYGF